MSTLANKSHVTEIPAELMEAIESFPTAREVVHCGKSIRVSPFDIYADCPACRARVKVRGYSGVPEIEDLFDAFFAWLSRPEAKVIASNRIQALQHDD